MLEAAADVRLALLLAGGEGRRLRPLTERTPKALVPFGGTRHVIDFALANLDASGFQTVLVPGPGRLLEGLEPWCGRWARTGGTLTTLPPPEGRYRGTGDAVYAALDAIRAFRPRIVAVLPSDHVYGRCLPEITAFHEGRRNRVTLAVARVPRVEASQLGIVAVDSAGYLSGYTEKPGRDAPFDGETCLASTGIFLFEPDYLADRMRGVSVNAATPDWDLTPGFFPGGDVSVFEIDVYWRDVGTIGGYWRAHLDLFGGRPVIDHPVPDWPGSPGKANPLRDHAAESLVYPGCRKLPAGVCRSVLADPAIVDDGATVHECILYGGVRVRAGAHLHRVIVDGPNDIPPGTRIDGRNVSDGGPCIIDPSGVAVVPAGTYRTA